MALNNVPLNGQSLAYTKPLIAGNFTVIDSAFSIDHVSYNTTGAGKHNKVTMPVQSVTPATLANEVALFSRTSTLSLIPEMAFRRNTNGTVIEFTSSLGATDGWTRLPSGILLKWGVIVTPRNTLALYPFPVAATIPIYTTLFNVTASQTFAAGPATGDLNTAVCVGNVTAANFQVYPRAIGLPSGGNVSIFYLATGV